MSHIFTTINVKLVSVHDYLNNLCSLAIFINILKYFNVDCIPTFSTPITNSASGSKEYLQLTKTLTHCFSLQLSNLMKDEESAKKQSITNEP